MASGLVVLLGIWLFVSLWVYGAYTNPNVWNSWIVGVLMVIFGGIQFGNATGLRFLSWLNCLFGIWTFCSPWIFGYTGNTGRFINSLCVGVIVFIAAIVNAYRVPQRAMPLHSLRPDFGQWGRTGPASQLRFPAMICTWDVFSKYLSFVPYGSGSFQS